MTFHCHFFLQGRILTGTTIISTICHDSILYDHLTLVHFRKINSLRRPQSFSCGLSEFLPRFSYIGSLDKIEHQARELLQNVGLWNQYGKYYHRFANTNDAKQGICSIEPPELKAGDRLFGFLQLPTDMDKTNKRSSAYRHSHHSTGSQSKIDKYYTSELKSLVEESLYPMDVKLWNLVQGEKNLVSGSELAIKISDQCMRRAKQLSLSTLT